MNLKTGSKNQTKMKNRIIKDSKYWARVNGELQLFWSILQELPKGWQIDNQTDAPVPHCVFINNGKNFLSGKKQALLITDKERYNNYIKNTKL